jgi:tetratricopeptide (TPR) repeat protein
MILRQIVAERRNSPVRWFAGFNLRVIVIMSTLSFLAPAICFSEQQKTDEVRKLVDRGEFAQAKAALENMATADQTMEWHFLLGKVRYVWGDIDKAADLFESAVKAKPDRSEFFLWWGRALGRKAEKAIFLKAPILARKSRDAFQRAVELDSDNLDARDDLLTFYLEAPGFLGGGRGKALALAEQIKSSHPCESHIQLAQVYRKENSFDRAESELRKAIEVKPACLGGYRALAELFESQSRTKPARETLEEAVRLFPKSPLAHFALGRFEMETGGNSTVARREMESFLTSYVSGEPYPFEAHYWLGRMFLKLNQPQKAQEEFQQALKSLPTHGPSLKGIVEAHSLQGSGQMHPGPTVVTSQTGTRNFP